MSRLAGTVPVQACAAGGHVCSTQQACAAGGHVCSTQQGWLHPARVGCPLGQVPAGAWCLGAPVLRLHRRVLPVAVSGPPSKGGPCMVYQQGDRCSAVACQAAAGVAVWASSQVRAGMEACCYMPGALDLCSGVSLVMF